MAHLSAFAPLPFALAIATPAFAQEAAPLPTTVAVAGTFTLTYLPTLGVNVVIAPSRWLALEITGGGTVGALDLSVEVRARSTGRHDKVTLGVATDAMFGLPARGQYFYSSAEVGWEHRPQDGRLYLLVTVGPRVFLGDRSPETLGAGILSYDLDAKSRALPVFPFLRFSIGGWVL